MVEVKVEKDSMKLETSIVNDENAWNSHYDEHAAASILRKVIENVEFPDDKYPSSESVSLEKSVQKMLKSLTSFIHVGWLLDDDAFKTTSKEECKLSHEKQRKCLALSECIVAINNKSFTHFHLGLALQMHHLECQTTRPVSENKSARMLRQLGPYYCFIILFNIYMCII